MLYGGRDIRPKEIAVSKKIGLTLNYQGAQYEWYWQWQVVCTACQVILNIDGTPELLKEAARVVLLLDNHIPDPEDNPKTIPDSGLKPEDYLKRYEIPHGQLVFAEVISMLMIDNVWPMFKGRLVLPEEIDKNDQAKSEGGL
jgi:hypothetical protein